MTGLVEDLQLLLEQSQALLPATAGLGVRAPPEADSQHILSKVSDLPALSRQPLDLQPQ